MKKFLLLSVSTLSLFCGFMPVHAQTTPDLSVTPVVIDEKGKPRDILKESIMVKNNTSHVLQLYPSVTDINSKLGDQGFQRAGDSVALQDSLANWVEISRGMLELSPGEQKAIPFIIRINLNAIPSAYHAQISLTQGATRAEADSKPALGVIMVNLEVQADIKEILQLTKFSTGNFFLSGDDVLFDFQLQNIGNQELQPKGQVHIYNRTGAEVATLDVNKDGKTVSPDQVSQLASVWTAAQGFGRYKAMLSVNYGAAQTASVQDTVFFWVIPWKQLLIIFSVSLILVVFLALQFHNWLEQRHFHKLAGAGLINDEALKQMQEPTPVVPLVALKEANMLTPKTKKHFWQFRRSKVSTDRTHKESPVAEVKEPQRSIRDVLKKDEQAKTQGSSINLKELRAQVQPVPQASERPATSAHIEGNIISLKKPK